MTYNKIGYQQGITMKCPYCKSKNTFTYYKADMPNILSACPKSMLDKVKTFPFEVKLCSDCLLGFNASRLNDDELKLIYDNYLYISPMSGIGHTKYEGILKTIKKYYKIDDNIVEIGCSEGYLLYQLRKEGYGNLTGIEPGPQADQARELSLNIIKNYFTENTFNGKLIDGFLLMHVFEHFDNPFLILEALKKQLSFSGKIVMEVPDFDGYHHQHLFLYNLPFLIKLCHEKGLKITEKNIEQGTLRLVIVHKDNDEFDEIKYSEKYSENYDKITKLAINQYNVFTKTILKLNQLLEHTKCKNVYWWGAGSSSVVFLNQINKDILEKSELIIIDGDNKKWGMYIPGLNIEVQPFTILANKSVDNIIIASQFYNEISETCKNHNISARNIEVII